MKTYWIVLADCTSFKNHQAIFIKGGPNPGPQDRVPETRAPAIYTRAAEPYVPVMPWHY